MQDGLVRAEGKAPRPAQAVRIFKPANGAIHLYLAQKAGRLMPADAKGRSVVV